MPHTKCSHALIDLILVTNDVRTLLSHVTDEQAKEKGGEVSCPTPPS